MNDRRAGPTEVTGILSVAAGLPSNVKVAVGETVATAVLLEVRFTVSPADGAAADNLRLSGVLFPLPTIVALGVTQVTAAFTFTTIGVGAA